MENLPLLPSSIYLPGEHELAEGSIDLPWSKNPDGAIGVFARDHGATLPHRLVNSAKSWLCHTEGDRRGAILPWNAEEAGKLNVYQGGRKSRLEDDLRAHFEELKLTFERVVDSREFQRAEAPEPADARSTEAAS